MNFFTILLSNDENNTITQLVKDKLKDVEVFHLNQNIKEIKKDSVFFICIGGDKTKKESWWLRDGLDKNNKGFKFIASIINLPTKYDEDDDKNFKIKVKIEYVFNEAIKRNEFIYWPDSFDTNASLATKGKQTQAIELLKNEKQYLSLLRGAMYYFPEIETFYKTFFGNDFLQKIKAPLKRFVEKNITFSEEKKLPSEMNLNDKISSEKLFSEQIIYYGVPGSGKSHKIQEQTKSISEDHKIRVVFHPEYTNADFVGQIFPRVDDGIDYRFKAGPFSRILKRAYKKPTENFYLIIEEINRGNAAAIFGDLFQLLDRNEEGFSVYPIENLDLNSYIRSKDDYFNDKNVPTSVMVGNTEWNENTGIRLPPNLSLLATMNTSDQNVFTLDNAFQRRWNMELVKNECNDENQMNATINVNNQYITWNNFQSQINLIIGKKGNESGLSSMEDKRLGCWFVKAENGKINKDVFTNKVLKYLWDDAFKFCRDEIFTGNVKNFEELQKLFDEIGFDIFAPACNLKVDDSATKPSTSTQELSQEESPVTPQPEE